MIGNAIRQARKNQGLTLQDVAKRVGCSRSYVWEVETGKIASPSFDRIKKISEALAVDVSVLSGLVSRKRMIDQEIELMALFRALNENEKEILIGIMKKYIKGGR